VSVTVYVPQDSGALSMGANAVVAAIEKEAQKRGTSIQIVRNGSRGMYWLEPLVEVATPNGRVAYGPVTAKAVSGLFEAGFLEGGKQALLGMKSPIWPVKIQSSRIVVYGLP
jgi:formate dehydrogenase iron-sulfur subunit